MDSKSRYFLLLIISGMASCNAQESKLKFPAFDDNGCSITIPIDKGYGEFIKEKDGFFHIDKSEFKDSTYMLYLPQSDLPSLTITVEALNIKRTATPQDFSKAIIKQYQNSLNKVDDVSYVEFDLDEVGIVNKVSYKFITNGMYSVYYSFFVNGKAITLGYTFVNNKSLIGPDQNIKQLRLHCP
jgi:hypothetical protein